MSQNLIVSSTNVFIHEAIRDIATRHHFIISFQKPRLWPKIDDDSVIICDQFNFPDRPENIVILLCYQNLPKPFTKLCHNTWIVGKNVSIGQMEQIITHPPTLHHKKTMWTDDHSFIPLVLSYACHIETEKLSEILNISPKQVYFYRRNLAKRLNLSKSLMTILSPFILTRVLGNESASET
ncbi:MAG: hypothetical protein ACRCZ6_17830 [Kluyvera sp.]|uniref:hypothetical protein n=1 Tax=Kluyvera sp. TaxID=1538228 RepID=UPI003F37393F